MANDEPTYEVPGEDFDRDREVDEAVRAGKRALASLERADDLLGAASGIGMFDILGGGLITGAVKHGTLSKARGALEDARITLEDFARELGDVPGAPVLDTRVVGRLLTVTDLLFDDVVSDVLVQKQILDARDKVKQARDAVNAALRRLHR